jgi:hypothetical protein
VSLSELSDLDPDACPLHGMLDIVWVADHYECGQCLAEAEDHTWD